MAFRYRLAKVLKLRRLEESQAADRLAEQRRLLELCRREIELLQSSWQLCRRDMYGQGEGLTQSEFQLACQRSRVLEQRLERAWRRRQQLEQQLQQCLAELEQRVSLRRGQQRHREERLQEWKKRQRRQQDKRDEQLVNGRCRVEVSDE